MANIKKKSKKEKSNLELQIEEGRKSGKRTSGNFRSEANMNSQFKEVSFVWGMGIGNLRWLLQVEPWTRVVHLTQLLSWCFGSIFPVSSSPNLSLPWRPLLSPFLPTFNHDQQHCNLPSPILPHFSSVQSPLPASFYCLPFKELRDCLFSHQNPQHLGRCLLQTLNSHWLSE